MIPITSIRYQKVFLRTVQPQEHRLLIFSYPIPQPRPRSSSSPGRAPLRNSKESSFNKSQHSFVPEHSWERLSKPQLVETVEAIQPRRCTHPLHPESGAAAQSEHVLGVLRDCGARARPAAVPTKEGIARARARTAAGGSGGPQGREVPAGAGGGWAIATPGTR